jgi:hypothetical protein
MKNDDLNTINESDRIWVYQSTRPFNPDEVAHILDSGKNFIENWAAHGKKLEARVLVLYNHFIIVAADEQEVMASGCSIDKSVHWIGKLGEDLNIDLLDRQTILWVNEMQQVSSSSAEEFETLAANHLVTDDILVFNNLVFNGKDLKHHWIIPAKESWHSRYFTLV